MHLRPPKLQVQLPVTSAWSSGQRLEYKTFKSNRQPCLSSAASKALSFPTNFHPFRSARRPKQTATRNKADVRGEGRGECLVGRDTGKPPTVPPSVKVMAEEAGRRVNPPLGKGPGKGEGHSLFVASSDHVATQLPDNDPFCGFVHRVRAVSLSASGRMLEGRDIAVKRRRPCDGLRARQIRLFSGCDFLVKVSRVGVGSRECLRGTRRGAWSMPSFGEFVVVAVVWTSLVIGCASQGRRLKGEIHEEGGELGGAEINEEHQAPCA